jgi:hydroxymethylglutaryl-CoA lyase
MLKLIECPRDAMQGIKQFIDTDSKVRYINQLLKVGYDTLDFGSFVSPKAIPQMRDTEEVLSKLDLHENDTKLLAIVANTRGAEQALTHPEISYLGYPFSISETFQLRNTNATISESTERVAEIQSLCVAKKRELVVYISMGFGNPYGDIWNADIVLKWVEQLHEMGVRILSLSDTIGVANPQSIKYLFSNVIPAYPDIEFGAHLHTMPHTWREKVESAYQAGCRRFDSAIKGYGGCPMAKDDLTGNMPTENLIQYFDEINADIEIDRKAFNKSMAIALEIFPH